MEQRVVVEDKTIDEIISKYRGCEGSLLKILEEVQDRHKSKYLPEATLEAVSNKTGILPGDRLQYKKVKRAA